MGFVGYTNPEDGSNRRLNVEKKSEKGDGTVYEVFTVMCFQNLKQLAFWVFQRQQITVCIYFYFDYCDDCNVLFGMIFSSSKSRHGV